MNENIHSGHRQRLRARFDQVGFDGWSEHEVLEFLMFGILKRCDTNALAHKLIDTCGGLSGVLNASHEVLTSIDGVGPQTAYYLRMLGAAFSYMNDNVRTNVRLNKINTPKYLQKLFAGKLHECFYLLLLDKNMSLLSKKLLFEGDFYHTDINITDIFRAAVQEDAPKVIAAHNHPSGVLAPSQADISTTQMIREALVLVDATLVEHYIVSGSECVGILEYLSKNKPNSASKKK